MTMEREEVRHELLAILGASRELPSDADGHLADAFLDRLQDTRVVERPTAPQRDNRRLDTRPRALLITTVAAVEGCVAWIFDHWVGTVLQMSASDGYNTGIHELFVALWVAQVAVTVGFLYVQAGGASMRDMWTHQLKRPQPAGVRRLPRHPGRDDIAESRVDAMTG